MIAHDTAAPATDRAATVRRSRVASVALWATQIVLAAMFLFAGGSKLLGAPAMVDLFTAIGFGQWFRYVTGAIEVSAAVALLIPSAALFGAMLIIPTMLGAAATNLFLGQSPASRSCSCSQPRQLLGSVATDSMRCSLADPDALTRKRLTRHEPSDVL